MSRVGRPATARLRARKAGALRQVFVALALWGVAALPAQAVSCDALRAAVDARIRSHGVPDFSLSVVDANQAPNGKVVGSCELGTKKLVYVAGPQTVAPAAVGAPSPQPMTSTKAGGAPMIVECFDGKVYTEGPCRK